jgi:voltage-gated potassium channel
MNWLVNRTNSLKELFALYCGVILSGASLYSIFEHKHFLDSIWWAVVTAMTVGYGDSFPLTLGGRLVGVAVMHIVPLFIIPLIIASLLNTWADKKAVFTAEEQEEILKDLKSIKKQLKIKK